MTAACKVLAGLWQRSRKYINAVRDRGLGI